MKERNIRSIYGSAAFVGIFPVALGIASLYAGQYYMFFILVSFSVLITLFTLLIRFKNFILRDETFTIQYLLNPWKADAVIPLNKIVGINIYRGYSKGVGGMVLTIYYQDPLTGENKDPKFVFELKERDYEVLFEYFLSHHIKLKGNAIEGYLDGKAEQAKFEEREKRLGRRSN